MIDREKILKYLRSPRYRPLKRKDLAVRLQIKSSQKEAFNLLLKDLIREGKIVKVKSGRFALPTDVDLVIGKLEANEKGFGFVVQDEPDKPDIFIPPNKMNTALHGDRVVARIVPKKPVRTKRRGKMPSPEKLEGKIIEVEERSSRPIVGTLSKTHNFLYVIPDNPRFTRDIYVSQKDAKKAKIGDKVSVKITFWESAYNNPEGKIIEVFGSPKSPWVDLKMILSKYELSQTFPSNVIKEVAKIPGTVDKNELKNRTDFRREVVLTIDPDDAKDFDDAISLSLKPNGNYLLGIHIADASHYVRPGTDLDKEAFNRGTSIYFPGRVIPMLPEKLSNNLCSLKQGETRFVKSVLAELSPDGIVLNKSFHNAVIRSRKRYTYKEVLQIVEKKDKKLRAINKETVPTLDLMHKLALTLMKKRMDRGSLQLNIPAVKVRVDQNGKAVSIEKEEQDIAHSMIEEFMLTANELVALELTQRGLPCVFRIHAKPSEEALMDFVHLVKSFGFRVPPVTTTKKIQHFLDSIKEHPDAPNINYHLLRSLTRAEYTTKNVGHYALALTHYAHFTSPIRRYPDLMVHRLLDSLIRKKKSEQKIDLTRLAAMAKHCSERERIAQEAEYDSIDLKKLEFLQEQIKQKKHIQMHGVIRNIMGHGFFVETSEWLIDGFVPVSTLTDDFYQSDSKRLKFTGKRTGRFFKVGQEVVVEPMRIDLAKRQVDFKVVSKTSR